MPDMPKAKSKTETPADAKIEAQAKTEPKTDAKTEVRIPLHDPVPSLFADGCHGANVIAGCVRLDLFVERGWPGATGTQQMVVGRIIMPLERLEIFARGMTELVKKLKEDKAAKTADAAAKTTAGAGG
jgi:hypothetical protein